MGRWPAVETARPEEREAAFRLIFQDAEDRETRVANALHLVELGELKEASILVVRGHQELSGAMVCLPVPGASALVWPPRVVRGLAQAQIEDSLVRHASAWLRQHGARLAQALLLKDEVHRAPPLERNGFRHITCLWYMRRELVGLGFVSKGDPTGAKRKQAPPPAGTASDEDGRIHYQTYAPGIAGFFHQTLLQTYEGTLDCPEVTGVRSISEIIKGHQAPDGPEMDHWWLAQEGQRPVGVLLMTETAGSETWDVAYVGVVPEARGRSVGRQLMFKAISEARAANMSQLALSVDARNLPAIRLYRSLGFQLYDQRDVYLAIWATMDG
jgi:GNAT superfamily N-acetyltransferase